MKTARNVDILIGAQFGSEGKGVVAAERADRYDTYVRTGGPNAGHSFVHGGKMWKMQSIPCGWINRSANLVLGAGAVVNPRILRRELEEISEVDPDIFDRLVVDHRATVLLDKHEKREGHTKGNIHQRIGSTGEGVGAARMDRMRRHDDGEPVLFGDYQDSLTKDDILARIMCVDTVYALEVSNRILLEGTQGAGLSLIHGEWPYCTSADTNASQFLADAGISPLRVNEIVMVARTFPIRVHGNSGPMYNELTWDDMSERLGRKVSEKTTVTKLTRRIGAWDEDLFEKSCIINKPTEVVLTFMDYLNPEDEGITNWNELSAKSLRFVQYVQRSFNVTVRQVGTGFDPEKGWISACR